MKPRLAIRLSVNSKWEWSAAEIAYLKKFARKKSVEQIARYLRRGRTAVITELSLLKISRRRFLKSWTPEEDAVLRTEALGKTAAWMAKKLGRTIGAVSSRACTLGVRFTYAPVPYICEQCGKTVTGRHHSYARSTNHFCSVRCHGIWRINRPCPLCGNAKRAIGSTCRACKHIYRTVDGHWHAIFRAKNRPTYKGMPFLIAWNPYMGGSFLAGAKWIYENIGRRPAVGWSLDIIKHEKGFVPGNLRWASHHVQADNKQHRTLGKMTDAEFAVEARRRGWHRQVAQHSIGAFVEPFFKK